MLKTFKIATVIAALALCLPAWLCLPRLRAADDATVQVYLDKCSVCHGADGVGKTAKGKQLKVKDVHLPEVQKMTEMQFADVILMGKGKDMDSFEKELGHDTCLKLAAYMKELAKK
jgi:mono/diheme cytochrome c family protein